jgi:hypothetical protein
MLDPTTLYALDADAAIDTATHPRPALVHALHGFVDAGGASRLVVQHLLAELETREVARFDVDQLVDYRSRRPRMVFRQDRFTDVEQHHLVVHAVRDEQGHEFYLLDGPEPDLQWERFTAAVIGLADRLGVGLVVGVHGIPWAAPHTRPVGITAHASDRELIAGRPRWVGDVEVPGHIGALLELRLAQAGRQAVGYTAHVPHYLAEAEFPPAAVALVEALTSSTDLALPTDTLRASGVQVLQQVDAQVADSPQTLEAVEGLERTYDAVVAGRTLAGPGLLAPTLPDDEMPGGDQIAAEAEAFLRGLDD